MTGALRIDKTIMVAGINPTDGSNELLSVTTFDPPAERIDGIYMLAGIAPDGSNVLLRLNADGTMGSSSGGGSLPAGGTTGQFLRGDEAWSNALLGPLSVAGNLATGDNPTPGTVQVLYTGPSGPVDAFTTTIGINRTITVLDTAPEGYFTNYPLLIGAMVDLAADTPEGYVFVAAGIGLTEATNDKDFTGFTGGNWEAHHYGSGSIDDLYGAYNFVGLRGVGHVDLMTGLYAGSLFDAAGTVTTAAGVYIQTPFISSTPAITNLYGVWIGNQVIPEATNPYAFWYNGTGANAGVYRINALGIMAYYNPSFATYTPGAANFERVVQQWNANVLEYGTEVGAGGGNVLRPVRLIGASVQVMGTVAFNGATPAARPDYTVTNPSVSRTLDVGAATLAELRAVVGTLAADLIAIGLLQ